MKKKNVEIKVCKGPISQSFDAEAAVEKKPLNLQHDGICHRMVVDMLMDEEEAVLNRMSPKIRDNGFIVVNDNGHGHVIEPVEDCWAAAFIPGVALSSADMEGDYAACTIVNTLNEGFVYASVHKDGKMEALGPVVTPCIIGNSAKPTGLYIPMNNREAIVTGVDVALDFLNAIEDVSKASEDGIIAGRIEEIENGNVEPINRKCNW